jgi:hypothetical protein
MLYVFYWSDGRPLSFFFFCTTLLPSPFVTPGNLLEVYPRDLIDSLYFQCSHKPKGTQHHRAASILAHPAQGRGIQTGQE